MTTWEERMAERAATRATRLTAEDVRAVGTRWTDEDRARARDWQQVRAAAYQQMVNTMTLGEAVPYSDPAYGNFACACPGPPVCCWQRFQHADRLNRAAHIVVKQASDLLARRMERQLGEVTS
jgi:hypothetical protein